jgi:hypothetical protein
MRLTDKNIRVVVRMENRLTRFSTLTHALDFLDAAGGVTCR